VSPFLGLLSQSLSSSRSRPSLLAPDRTLTRAHLGQLAYVFPEAYKLELIEVRVGSFPLNPVAGVSSAESALLCDGGCSCRMCKGPVGTTSSCTLGEYSSDCRLTRWLIVFVALAVGCTQSSAR
jgi:hypothetical protein